MGNNTFTFNTPVSKLEVGEGKIYVELPENLVDRRELVASMDVAKENLRQLVENKLGSSNKQFAVTYYYYDKSFGNAYVEGGTSVSRNEGKVNINLGTSPRSFSASEFATRGGLGFAITVTIEVPEKNEKKLWELQQDLSQGFGINITSYIADKTTGDLLKSLDDDFTFYPEDKSNLFDDVVTQGETKLYRINLLALHTLKEQHAVKSKRGMDELAMKLEKLNGEVLKSIVKDTEYEDAALGHAVYGTTVKLEEIKSTTETLQEEEIITTETAEEKNNAQLAKEKQEEPGTYGTGGSYSSSYFQPEKPASGTQSPAPSNVEDPESTNNFTHN